MGTKMFKIGSFEAELLANMQKSLVSSQLENKFSLDKLSKAADYINTAAELLDDTGFRVEADMLTKVLKRLANDNKEHIQNMVEEELANPQDEEVIIEPLTHEEVFDPFAGQEINVEEVGAEPLDLESITPVIQESPEYLQFKSIANKIAAKKNKKKV